MMQQQQRTLIVIILSSLLLQIAGCVMNQETYTPEIGGDIPWAKKPFLNNPDDFQFVIIGDRTGGHRPGVFTRAIQQINLLQPEFVVSVGDLIEGYTEDPELLDREWRELDAAVDNLNMPFFYTVGNHDVGNNLMREVWHRRLGQDFYSFIYKEVLFISLNTEDPPIKLSNEALSGQTKLEEMMRSDPVATQRQILERSRSGGFKEPLPGEVAISQAQLDFVRDTLIKHKNVRWTIILMHKPAWQYKNPAFSTIEKMLRNRDYTVIAGHEHYYMYTNHHGRDYVAMGTTGGLWLRDGPGSVDHISWVTMTDSGLKFAHIKLDGLFDKQGPEQTAEMPVSK